MIRPWLESQLLPQPHPEHNANKTNTTPHPRSQIYELPAPSPVSRRTIAAQTKAERPQPLPRPEVAGETRPQQATNFPAAGFSSGFAAGASELSLINRILDSDPIHALETPPSLGLSPVVGPHSTPPIELPSSNADQIPRNASKNCSRGLSNHIPRNFPSRGSPQVVSSQVRQQLGARAAMKIKYQGILAETTGG